MSIEQHLIALTEALNKNTDALLAAANNAGQATAAMTEPSDKEAKATKAKATKTKEPEAKETKAKGPVHTQAETTAAILKIKDEFGIDEAKKVIAQLGFAKMSDITEDKYDEGFDLAEKVYAELKANSDTDSDDGDDL